METTRRKFLGAAGAGLAMATLGGLAVEAQPAGAAPPMKSLIVSRRLTPASNSTWDLWHYTPPAGLTRLTNFELVGRSAYFQMKTADGLITFQVLNGNTGLNGWGDQVFIMRPDGTGLRELFRTAELPVRPSGDRIAQVHPHPTNPKMLMLTMIAPNESRNSSWVMEDYDDWRNPARFYRIVGAPPADTNRHIQEGCWTPTGDAIHMDGWNGDLYRTPAANLRLPLSSPPDRNAPPLDGRTRITYNGAGPASTNLDPAVSPDGRLVACARPDDLLTQTASGWLWQHSSATGRYEPTLLMGNSDEQGYRRLASVPHWLDNNWVAFTVARSDGLPLLGGPLGLLPSGYYVHAVNALNPAEQVVYLRNGRFGGAAPASDSIITICVL